MSSCKTTGSGARFAQRRRCRRSGLGNGWRRGDFSLRDRGNVGRMSNGRRSRVTGRPPTPSSISLCGVSLALALILLAAASVCLGIGGCLGPAGLPLTTTGIGLSVTGLVVLALWIALCRDCLLMRFLQRFFGAMALLMLIIMALLMLVGMAMCAMGALAIAALFGVMVAALSIGIAILGCP